MNTTINANILKVAVKMTDEGNRTEMTAKYLQRRVESKVEQVAQQAELIKSRMENLLKGLEEQGADFSFNSLGEMQGKGSDLDRMLGELATMREMYLDLATL